MRDGNSSEHNVERHIFRVLPPSKRLITDNCQKSNIRTANLVDYCSYLRDGNVDLSEILFDGVEFKNVGESNFDVGETYIIVNGSIEHAEGLMKTMENNFNSYLEKNSKSKYYPKFNYQLIN
jgi:hypothetical protein